jgi:hypothetical protein
VREHTTAAAPPRDAINSWSLQVAARRELIVGDGTLHDGGSDPGPRKHYARLRIGLQGWDALPIVVAGRVDYGPAGGRVCGCRW